MRHPSRLVTRSVAGFALSAVALAACGGDDGGGAVEEATTIPVTTDVIDVETTDDTTVADTTDPETTVDVPGATGPDTTEGPTGMPEGVELPPELIAGLEEMGLDLDDLADLDPEEMEELFGELEGLLSGMSGDGGGIVTVDGVTYTVEADICLALGSDFTLDGPAAGSDGSIAWVAVHHTIMARADMEEFMDDELLDMFFPDGVDTVTDFSLDVGVGQTERFDATADGPQWTIATSPLLDAGEVDFEIADATVSGTGQAENWGLGAEPGATAPVEFELGCD